MFLQLLSHRRTLHLLRNKLLTIPILLGRLLHRIFSIRHPLRKLVCALSVTFPYCVLRFSWKAWIVIWIILWLRNFPLQKCPLMWIDTSSMFTLRHWDYYYYYMSLILTIKVSSVPGAWGVLYLHNGNE